MKTCKTCRKWYPISDTMGMCYAPGEFIKLAHESCGRWEHETAGAQKGERLKKSDGFCGYGWMVDNILAYGSPYGKPKEVNGYEEESNELDVYAPEVSE